MAGTNEKESPTSSFDKLSVRMSYVNGVNESDDCIW